VNHCRRRFRLQLVCWYSQLYAARKQKQQHQNNLNNPKHYVHIVSFS